MKNFYSETGELHKIFSRNLKRERKLQGLTQQALATKAGFCRSVIGNIETLTGNYKNSTLDTVARISAALNVEPCDLLVRGEA